MCSCQKIFSRFTGAAAVFQGTLWKVEPETNKEPSIFSENCSLENTCKKLPSIDKTVKEKDFPK